MNASSPRPLTSVLFFLASFSWFTSDMVTCSSVPMQLAWPCGLPWSSWAQAACLDWSFHESALGRGISLGWLLHCVESKLLEQPAGLHQGQEILVSARNLVRGRRWGRWRIGQLLLQRHFSATFSIDLSQQIYLSSIFCFLWEPLVLPINKWHNL